VIKKNWWTYCLWGTNPTNAVFTSSTGLSESGPEPATAKGFQPSAGWDVFTPLGKCAYPLHNGRVIGGQTIHTAINFIQATLNFANLTSNLDFFQVASWGFGGHWNGTNPGGKAVKQPG
jgi:hypothetical protein